MGSRGGGIRELTTDLPARDPLLPESYYYLGQAHFGHHEYILAAQSFSRVAENFPEDSLADRATYETGVSYAKLWRRPALDPEYGETARSTFQSFMAAYPDSPLRDSAQKQIERLDEWFATKGYDNGVTYYKRKAYDSGIIYFRDVVKDYPKTDGARKSLIRLVQSYKEIKYKEDVAETCGTLEQRYPGDKDVTKVCKGVKATIVADTTAKNAGRDRCRTAGTQFRTGAGAVDSSCILSDPCDSASSAGRSILRTSVISSPRAMRSRRSRSIGSRSCRHRCRHSSRAPCRRRRSSGWRCSD